MTRTVGAMHVAKISRHHGDREYDSYLVRRTIREAIASTRASSLPPSG